MDILLGIFIILPILVFGLAASGVFSKRVINKGELLKYTNDFLELYEANEEEFTNELFEFKKIEKIKNISALFIELGLLLLGVYELSLGGENSIWALFLFMVAIVDLFAILALNNHYSKQYKEMFKECIIRPYVEKSNPSLQYEVSGGIDNEEYKNAGFDNKDFTNVEKDDHIWGNIVPNVYMDMSEVKTIYKREFRNKNGKLISSSSSTIFHGMVAILKSTKFNFGTIYIKKDKLKLLPQKDRIKIDSVDFEKYFDAYSSNRTEAKRLLDFQLVNALVKFKVESGLDFEMVIKGSTIYLRFFTGPMFEPSTLSKMKEKEMLWIYHMICDFIKQLEVIITEDKNEGNKMMNAQYEDRYQTDMSKYFYENKNEDETKDEKENNNEE